METKGMTKWLRIAMGLVLVCGTAGWGQCPKADLTGDCRVDLADFAVFAEQWLTVYDYDDLATMVIEWSARGAPESAITWVSINDPGVSGHEGFSGEMSKYKTTNAQYCHFLNAALFSGDITVRGSDVIGAIGYNSGADFAGQWYYDLTGSGYNYNGATKGGAARINFNGGQFTVDSGFENHPVTYESWYGATAFCNYYGTKGVSPLYLFDFYKWSWRRELYFLGR